MRRLRRPGKIGGENSVAFQRKCAIFVPFVWITENTLSRLVNLPNQVLSAVLAQMTTFDYNREASTLET